MTMFTGAVTTGRPVTIYDRITIAADATTPSVTAGTIFFTSANTGATAITGFTGGKTGQMIILIGGSDTNSTTIADSGNFILSGAWTAAANDVLILYSPNGTAWIELGRVNN